MSDQQEYTDPADDSMETPAAAAGEMNQNTGCPSTANPGPNIALATVGAVLGATVGACIWFAIAYFANYRVGFVAIASGALAGLFASKLGKGKCATIGVIAALAGGAGVLGGSWVTYYALKHSDRTRQELKKYFDVSCSELAKVAADVDKTEAKRHEARRELAKEEAEGFEGYYKRTIQDPNNNYIVFITLDGRDTGIMIMMGLLGMYCGYRAGSGEQA